MSDQERKVINKLIIGISRDSEKDLEQLYEMTKDSIYALVRKYVECDLAEDAFAHVYLQIYKKSRHFNPQIIDGYEWMCKITEEVSIKYVLKHKKKAKQK